MDDEAAERAEVLFVGVPGSARVGGRLVAVLVDAFVVAVGDRGAGVQRTFLLGRFAGLFKGLITGVITEY
ncbi:hypothetical protein [Streptomyces sp. GbtcB7]|uniref:hypothetical protein n=1 Tax=Streptomyces sp. GbtcB7 TaxID=2824752 RepID=UPI0027E538DF|nr:hypothetical protein [Streptomyces sp. GbtcB7]